MTIQPALDRAMQHHQAGRLQEAEAIYRQILAQEPNHPDALHLLGVIAGQAGRHDAAVALIRQAIAAKPDQPDYHCNLGIFLQELDRLEQAITCFQRALELKDDYAEAHYNLGNAFLKKKQLDQAIACYRRAMQIKPNYPEIHNNLGAALMEQGQLDPAMPCFQRALEIRPAYPEAHFNLGSAWWTKGQLDQAIACYQQALALKTNYAEAYNNLGLAWKGKGKPDQAIACFGKALELNPRLVSAHDNLLLVMHDQVNFDATGLLAQSRKWNQQHAEPLKSFIQPHTNDRDSERRLRVGYVSPDFREHSVAYFLESLLAGHDPAQVEVFCYADLPQPDQVTQRLAAHAGHWQNITGQSDAQVCQQVRRDGIDILVDLAGHTAGNRLLVFARKPAPIQITYLGYPNTTGLCSIDYRISDALADPPGSENLCTEELIRLPGCFLCFSPPAPAPAPGPLPALDRGYITFASFNALHKLNSQVVAVWAQLLQRLPTARLVIKSRPLIEAAACRQLLDAFAAHGIAPQRLELLGRIPTRQEHLVVYQRIDMALDTFPYDGTATTCEALWMGVPVVTLAGCNHMSRVGVSLLSNIGLPQLIGQSPDEYVKIAAELADDLPRLAELRATLRRRMQSSRLMDGRQFARGVEDAYRNLWRKWCWK